MTFFAKAAGRALPDTLREEREVKEGRKEGKGRKEGR